MIEKITKEETFFYEDTPHATFRQCLMQSLDEDLELLMRARNKLVSSKEVPPRELKESFKKGLDDAEKSFVRLFGEIYSSK